MSSMSPIIIFATDGSNDTIVVGGAGGSAIVSGVAGVAMQMLLAKKDVKFALDAPRIHNQLRPNITQYEQLLPQASAKVHLTVTYIRKYFPNKFHIEDLFGYLLSFIDLTSTWMYLNIRTFRVT